MISAWEQIQLQQPPGGGKELQVDNHMSLCQGCGPEGGIKFPGGGDIDFDENRLVRRPVIENYPKKSSGVSGIRQEKQIRCAAHP